MKLAIFSANGFEEGELINTVDIIRRANIIIDIISITKDFQVVGGHNIKILADKLLDNIDIQSYDGFILPGGGLGVENLLKCDKLLDLLIRANKSKKIIGAICAAPQILGKLNIIKNKTITHYPGAERYLDQANKINSKPAIIDKNIITGASIGCAIEFALLFVVKILGKEKANELRKTLVIR